MLGKSLGNQPRLRVRQQTRKAHQHHARMNEALPEHEFTDVGVQGDEQRAAPVRLVKNHFVANAGLYFGDVKYVVVVPTESFNDLTLDALVGQQVHAVTFSRAVSGAAAEAARGYTTSARRA